VWEVLIPHSELPYNQPEFSGETKPLTELLSTLEPITQSTAKRGVNNDSKVLKRAAYRHPLWPNPGVPSSFLPLVNRIEENEDVNRYLPYSALKSVSQPKGQKLEDIKNYVYRVRDPYRSRIYIVDSGASKTSLVCNFLNY
jgi:hypothetical protein